MVRRGSSTHRQAILSLRQTDQSVLAQGETEWVFVDAATGRPRAIPPSIKALFRVVPDGPGTRTRR